MDLRPYDPDTSGDPEALWRLKRAFERELGGDDAEKRRAYEGKLTEGYRRRYLEWVERCVEDDPRCLTVADPGSGAGDLVGYAFLLPERLGMVWDGAVLNEIYVTEPHRGTGVADDLLATTIGVARGQDPPLPRILLDVDHDNDRARGLYERHGFTRWGEMLAREL